MEIHIAITAAISQLYQYHQAITLVIVVLLLTAILTPIFYNHESGSVNGNLGGDKRTSSASQIRAPVVPQQCTSGSYTQSTRPCELTADSAKPALQHKQTWEINERTVPTAAGKTISHIKNCSTQTNSLCSLSNTDCESKVVTFVQTTSPATDNAPLLHTADYYIDRNTTASYSNRVLFTQHPIEKDEDSQLVVTDYAVSDEENIFEIDDQEVLVDYSDVRTDNSISTLMNDITLDCPLASKACAIAAP